ncbi:MsnO8 family LLM class oxidoreductase [Aeromicrobium sp. CTD01-1L150]|uniref:MsnO8 family LLM class oxidoreductase n=1 Tax=Aeromicrobium sp. CTD01-1L150 TaxID=3341830 RepID=UPI0035C0655D
MERNGLGLSILDRSRTRAGEQDADALERTVERAARAEELGYDRFWVAEHHAVPGIASGSPTVLMAAVAARTRTIRVGSGGVMLPLHQPVVVAEQALMLEALHPGRIDLGIGRSLGFTAAVRDALRVREADVGRFAEDVAELRSYLDGTGPVTARPAVTGPPVLVLATGEGVAVAARAGLPVVVGGPALRDPSLLQRYREEFVAHDGTRPQVLVSVDVMVAESTERARELLLPEAWAMALSRETGSFEALRSLEELRELQLTDRRRRSIQRTLDAAVAGDPDAVGEQLDEVLERTGADELLAWSSTFDPGDQAASDEALAALFGRVPRATPAP